jgi:hypothetical protein
MTKESNERNVRTADIQAKIGTSWVWSRSATTRPQCPLIQFKVINKTMKNFSQWSWSIRWESNPRFPRYEARELVNLVYRSHSVSYLLVTSESDNGGFKWSRINCAIYAMWPNYEYNEQTVCGKQVITFPQICTLLYSSRSAALELRNILT